MQRLLRGLVLPRAVQVAAELGLADVLAEGPQPVHVLAARVGASPDALFRLMRVLASIGIFVETAPRVFGLTPLAATLRSDVPGSLRAMARWNGSETYWRSLGELLYSVRTGEPAFPHVFGAPMFDYFASHPEIGSIFEASMAGVSAAEVQAVAEACDLSGVSILADIGGGSGELLLALLQRYPTLRAILLELPAVIEQARLRLGAQDLLGRVDLLVGSFFEQVPTGADRYVLKNILHDWPDQMASRLLQQVRAALSPYSRLLVLEQIVPEGSGASLAKWADLTMLVNLGGRERTEAELRTLLQTSGFHLRSVIPTRSRLVVLEAEAV
jgi:hypothetical protein